MEDSRSGTHFLGLSAEWGNNDSVLLNFNTFMVYLKPYDLSEINNATNIDYLLCGSHQYQHAKILSPCFQRALQSVTLLFYIFQGIGDPLKRNPKVIVSPAVQSNQYSYQL